MDPKSRLKLHQLDADRVGVAVVLKPKSRRLSVLDVTSRAA